MIAFLRGPVLRRGDEVVVIEAGGVGYEVHLPAVVARALPAPHAGDHPVVELHISFHATQNQPRPLLIGFLHEVEQEFFERFITVDGMGPTKAMKAIVHPIHMIADAIERKDVGFLRRLPGIGEDLAAKIVEIVETGKCQFLEKLRKKIPPTITELLKIPGLGPKRVRALYHELDVHTLEQLARAARDGKRIHPAPRDPRAA